MPLACLPVILSIQQFCEGLVWLGLDHGNTSLARTAALWFLFFAIVFWLFWLPFSVLLIETHPGIRRALGCVSLLGLVFGGMLYGSIWLDPASQLSGEEVNHSLHYDCSGPQQTHQVPHEVW